MICASRWGKRLTRDYFERRHPQLLGAGPGGKVDANPGRPTARPAARRRRGSIEACARSCVAAATPPCCSQVTAMEPADFQAWLQRVARDAAGAAVGSGRPTGGNPDGGKALIAQNGCVACHAVQGDTRSSGQLGRRRQRRGHPGARYLGEAYITSRSRSRAPFTVLRLPAATPSLMPPG